MKLKRKHSERDQSDHVLTARFPRRVRLQYLLSWTAGVRRGMLSRVDAPKLFLSLKCAATGRLYEFADHKEGLRSV